MLTAATDAHKNYIEHAVWESRYGVIAAQVRHACMHARVVTAFHPCARANIIKRIFRQAKEVY